MSTEMTLYIAPNTTGGNQCHVYLIPHPVMGSVSSLDPSTLEMKQVGIVREELKAAGRLFHVVALDKPFSNLKEDLEQSMAGVQFPLAKDVNGDFYITDSKGPLFKNWSTLHADKKKEIGKRIETQMDPFRQQLLHTLMNLPEDQILDVFDYGFSQYNARLMAIAVQALPESVLANQNIASQMAAEMGEVVKHDRAFMNHPILRTPITDYPLFYAVEKLKSGRHDCHKQAWAAASDDYLHTYNPSLCEKAMTPYPDQCHEGFMGFIVAKAENLIDQNMHKKAAIMIMATAKQARRFSTVEKSYIEDYSVVSMAHGYRRWEELAQKTHDQIACDLVGPDILLEALVRHLTSIDNMNMLDSPDILEALSHLGIKQSFDRIETEIVYSTDFNSVFFCDLIDYSVKRPTQNREAVLAVCDLHVRYDDKLFMGIDRVMAQDIQSDSDILEVYVARKAIYKLLDKAFKKITDQHSGLGSDLATKVNTVINYTAIGHNLEHDPETMNACDFATSCLALSGTRHTDIIAAIDAEAMPRFLYFYKKHRLELDTRSMIKANPLCKGQMLEVELGL